MKNSEYNTKSAVLFLIFNRPETTEKVFQQIKLVKPGKLYIAADGPRSNISGEDAICKETKELILKNIDWDCEIKTLFRDKNIGCKYAVSGAIDWFFKNEDEGIILEDDCLPNVDFFRFCDMMLNYYKNDIRIRHIGGVNLQFGNLRGEYSHYFSNLSHVWGWATWRRAWEDYDVELSKYKNLNIEKQIGNIFYNKLAVKSWLEIYKLLFSNKINTWDYQWAFTNFFNNGLSVIPNKNLISNIGFGEKSTHTTNPNDKYSKMEVVELGEITYPIVILPDKEADLFTLENNFNLKEQERNIKRKQTLFYRVTRFYKIFKIKNI